MKNAFIIAVLFLYSFHLFGKEDSVIVRKAIHTHHCKSAPVIDGKLEDAVWQQAETISDFIQNNPTEGAPVSFNTEVRVLYDNMGIYFAAKCYDNAPDSIQKQLGVRDSYVNADNFRVVIDTYNTQQDAFDFTVTASGIQMDSRFSDPNYNAVWKSNVQILKDGWSVEMAIPWSALRFPTEKGREWGIQFTRFIQRKFEFDQWALTPKGSANPLRFWGLLKGLEDIQSPVRLSLTPYLTGIWEDDNRFGPSDPSASLSGGMDVKYGINESFTIDMTLLPDFSQVQSDNIVKNLSAFEIQFQDFRPFFNEGVDLFRRGDLFYSRRIGKTPAGFYSAPYMTNENEVVIKNPSRARLLNATKLSGRMNNGTGIGILNAIVDNTYATLKDTITGQERKLLTEPRANYNILVFDKQLKNSSSIYVINTNVIRTGKNSSANVTCAGFDLNNKENSWRLSGDGAVSNILTPNDSIQGEFNSKLGYRYNLSIDKTSGTWQYGFARSELSKNWDNNDLGILFERNFSSNSAYVGYYIFNPKWIFNQANFNLRSTYQYNLTDGELMGLDINMFNFFQFRNFWSYYIGFNVAPLNSKDYFEPRTPGRYYERIKNYNVFMGLNSNYNKKLSAGMEVWAGRSGYISPTIPVNPWIGGGINITYRANDRFNISAGNNIHTDWGDRGWVHTEDDGAIVFGRRNIRNIESNINLQYVFMKDMSINLIGRHYWATGNYLSYYILQEDGTLHDYITYEGNHDFSFNSFNIDIVYQWIFAPGSILSISWKQNMLYEEPMINYSYSYNINNTIHGPQLNQLSVRVLYYLDYQMIHNATRKRASEN